MLVNRRASLPFLIKSTLSTLLACSFSFNLLANGLPMSEPEAVGISAERLQNLPKAMQRYIDKNLLAGTITLVARDGKVVHLQSQGWKNKESGEAMSDDTIFFIMSMTKPIVSTALMMLYEEGHFLLTDPISNWIPEIADKAVIVQDDSGVQRVPAARAITFRHVLSHTAGLDPDRSLLTEDERELLRREDNLEDTIVKWAPLPLAFHPGDDWQYGSSTDYVALLVERIAGRAAADVGLGVRQMRCRLERLGTLRAADHVEASVVSEFEVVVLGIRKRDFDLRLCALELPRRRSGRVRAAGFIRFLGGLAGGEQADEGRDADQNRETLHVGVSSEDRDVSDVREVDPWEQGPRRLRGPRDSINRP